MKESAPAVDEDYATLEKAEDLILKPNSFIYEELATQKLQEMYDLINLKDNFSIDLSNDELEKLIVNLFGVELYEFKEKIQ